MAKEINVMDIVIDEDDIIISWCKLWNSFAILSFKFPRHIN